MRGGGWWAAAGGGWTWACGLCSSPRGVAQMTDKTCSVPQERGGEGRRGGAPAVRCQAVRGGREFWVAMGHPECLWPSWDAWWAVSGGDGRGLELRFLLVSFWEGMSALPTCHCGKGSAHLCPWSLPASPPSPQTPDPVVTDQGWGSAQGGPSGHRGCGQDGPISPSSLISSSPSSFQVVSPQHQRS